MQPVHVLLRFDFQPPYGHEGEYLSKREAEDSVREYLRDRGQFYDSNNRAVSTRMLFFSHADTFLVDPNGIVAPEHRER